MKTLANLLMGSGRRLPEEGGARVVPRGRGGVRQVHDLAVPRGVPRGPAEARSTLDRARSRLYRNEILQENMRLKALAESYTMHSFAQFCNLIFCLILPIFFGISAKI